MTLNEIDRGRTNIKTKFITLKENVTQCTRYWDIKPLTDKFIHYRIDVQVLDISATAKCQESFDKT